MTSADSLVPNYWRHFDAWSQSMKAWSMVYHQSIVPTPRKPRKWSTYLDSVDRPRIGPLAPSWQPFLCFLLRQSTGACCDMDQGLFNTHMQFPVSHTLIHLRLFRPTRYQSRSCMILGMRRSRGGDATTWYLDALSWAVQKWKYNVSFCNLQLFLVSEWSPSERHDVDALLALVKIIGCVQVLEIQLL